ncbi:MAG: hypothetical protein OXR72_09250 [Gemmatimonadota bacterium]|nr:hypothetical protein [Gemmatimonadota bacterium]
MRLEALKFLYDVQNNVDALAIAVPISYHGSQKGNLMATFVRQQQLLAKNIGKWPTNCVVGHSCPTTIMISAGMDVEGCFFHKSRSITSRVAAITCM